MTKEEEGQEEGSDDQTVKDGTDDKGAEGSKSTDQSSSSTSKDKDGKQDDQSKGQSSDDQGNEGGDDAGNSHDAAEAKKSYDNLLGVSQDKSQTIKERDDEIVALKAKAASGDGGDANDGVNVKEQVQHELLIQRRFDNNRRVLSDPKVRDNSDLLSEMETVLSEQPDLKNLANGMEMARDIARGRISETGQATAEAERAKEARGEKNDDAKSRSAGHQQGASQKQYEDTDRVESTKDMTPEQRDEYARQHSFE